MRFMKFRAPLLAPLILIGCSDAPTLCDGALPQLQQQADISDWRMVVDSLLAVAPPDSVLYIVVFLHPQAKQAFVDWAVSTGGGFGYGPVIAPPESLRTPSSDPENRRGRTGAPEAVPGVMIRYEYNSFSGYSVYMPVWALEGLKEQNITGVDFGLGAGDLPLC